MMKEFMHRLVHLLKKNDFRHHPIRAIWKRIYWRLHWKVWPSRPFIVPFYGGLRIRLAHSSVSLGVYLNRGFSDREISERFIAFLKPGMIALDCGAHIGEYALLFAHLVGREGEVHAFEPDPRVYSILEENIRLNSLRNVVINKVALSNLGGEAEFFIGKDPAASSLVAHEGVEGGRRLRVTITTIDKYVQSHELARVDALKVDVEGVAGLVLKGASQTLSEFKPGLVVVECEYGDDINFILSFLKSYGYKTSFIRKGRHRWTIIEAVR